MRRFQRWLHRLEGAVLAACMLLMAASTVGSVLVRNLTGEGWPATEELNQFLIVVLCFVGLSHAAGEGRHIRMSALSDAVPEGARRYLMLVVTATTSLLLGWLTFLAWNYALGVDRTSPVLGVPVKYVLLVAPLGLAAGAVQYALAALRNLRGDGVWVAFDVPDGPELQTLEGAEVAPVRYTESGPEEDPDGGAPDRTHGGGA